MMFSGVSSENLSQIIDYMYEGKIRINEGILKAGKALQIPSLSNILNNDGE